MIKILGMLEACITTFDQSTTTSAIWLSYPEGPMGLLFDLSANPPINILYGLYARVMFLPAYYQMAWEEAFTTGFFEIETQIFSPFTKLDSQFIAYSVVEQRN